MSPSLRQALDACLEPVVGWYDDQPASERLAGVAAARGEPARVLLLRRLADAAVGLMDRYDLLLGNLRWGRQPLFVGVRLAAKVLVLATVFCLLEYLLVAAVSEAGR